MKKLLFIGNSHTYVNALPHLVAELFRIYENEEVMPVMLTQGGVTLRWHSDQDQTAFNIRYGGYDYVVMQQATHPFDGAECLLRGAQMLLPLIRQKGEKYFPDLKAINALALRRAGIRHIEISDACTWCESQRFWSHRVTKGDRGSQGAVITCKEGKA